MDWNLGVLADDKALDFGVIQEKSKLVAGSGVERVDRQALIVRSRTDCQLNWDAGSRTLYNV